MLSYLKYIKDNDPACSSLLEVVFAYPGVHAVAMHRISHFIWKTLKLKTLARIFSHLGRLFTGIEIHPGAQIGRYLLIDHGMGVVIGQTAIIGDYVTLYHGVTLGGKGNDLNLPKRHPTIEDNVVVGAGAQVLGNITIGENAKIGANAVVTKDIPEGCSAVGNPARLVNCGGEGRAYGLPREWQDPVAETIDGLLEDVRRLKEEAGLKEISKEDRSSKDYKDRWKGSGI